VGGECRWHYRTRGRDSGQALAYARRIVIASAALGTQAIIARFQGKYELELSRVPAVVAGSKRSPLWARQAAGQRQRCFMSRSIAMRNMFNRLSEAVEFLSELVFPT